MCPHCGYPLERDRRARKLAVGTQNFSTFMMLVGGSVVFLIGASSLVSFWVWRSSDQYQPPRSIEEFLGSAIGFAIVTAVPLLLAMAGISIISNGFRRLGWTGSIKEFYSDKPDWAPWATGAAVLALLWAIALLFG